ncbi:MFS transporter [Candidatus Bathyarchaeota archaeon]|nr:MFS transporter [Candidatus Bathyarchaeota archaeon]
MGNEDKQKSIFWFVTGNIRVLMACRMIWSLSTSMVYPFFSLYILALGGTSTEIGIINSLGLLAGMVLYPVGGYVADRAGRVKLIGYSTILYTLTHLFFVFATNWQVIALGQFFSQFLLFYTPAMNALESDSLPPSVRGKGFALMMAIPGTLRIIAPYVGGLIINVYGGGDEGLVQAVRLCWGIAAITGFLISYLRIKYLKETVTSDETLTIKSFISSIIPSYKSIIESIRWMDRSLKALVVVEIVSAFFVAMSAPFWVVYSNQIYGLSAYEWGQIMLLSGLVGIIMAYPMGTLVDKIGPRKMILFGMGAAPIVTFAFRYATGFIGVTIILCSITIINNMLMPGFSTIIANMIPKERRGRLYSLLGERGVMISFGNFWGGGFLLFPAAALGSYIGGVIYSISVDALWIIMPIAFLITSILAYIFIKEPETAHL